MRILVHQPLIRLTGIRGLAGLEKFREIGPDITFLDLTMPVMDGAQALEEMKKQNPDAVIIEFSINDAATGSDLTTAQARKNLETMVERILAHRPDCAVILMIMNPPVGVHLEARPRVEPLRVGQR